MDKAEADKLADAVDKGKKKDEDIKKNKEAE